jgi:hypothetical protein
VAALGIPACFAIGHLSTPVPGHQPGHLRLPVPGRPISDTGCPAEIDMDGRRTRPSVATEHAPKRLERPVFRTWVERFRRRRVAGEEVYGIPADVLNNDRPGPGTGAIAPQVQVNPFMKGLFPTPVER